MSVYNDAAYLEAAISSILGQSFTDFEFIIVNDGSTDTSSQIIDALAASDPRIVAIHQPNQGLVSGLNRGLSEARAPLVARMDGDDIALRDRLGFQLARLEEDPRIGVLGTQAEFIDEAGNPTTPVAYPVAHEDFPSSLRGPLFCHPTVVMRRDLVFAVGGYRRAYKHCEDLDLWLRLHDRCRFENLPQRLLKYRRSASQVSRLHLTQQILGAEIAHVARAARRAGKPDPTAGSDTLPPLDEVDAAFAQPGVASQMRANVTRAILNAPSELRGAGFAIVLAHAKDTRLGGSSSQRRALWRTCLRLARLGEVRRSVQLASALLLG